MSMTFEQKAERFRREFAGRMTPEQIENFIESKRIGSGGTGAGGTGAGTGTQTASTAVGQTGATGVGGVPTSDKRIVVAGGVPGRQPDVDTQVNPNLVLEDLPEDTGGERLRKRALIALRQDIQDPTSWNDPNKFENLVRRYGSVLEPFEIRDEYNRFHTGQGGEPWGPAKEDEYTVGQWAAGKKIGEEEEEKKNDKATVGYWLEKGVPDEDTAAMMAAMYVE